MGLEGRVALVNGASRGIGRACALRLAQAGASVALAGRDEQKLGLVAEQIAGSNGKAATFKMDVASEEEVKSAVRAVLAQFGKIDILINNAGITHDQLVMRMKRADWDAVLNTNMTRDYECIQQVIGSM